MYFNELKFADPILDVPQPMIEAFEADAAIEAGALVYIKADGSVTTLATESDGNDGTIATTIWGVCIEGAAKDATAQALYRGDVRNVWDVTDANVRRLSNVGVILR